MLDMTRSNCSFARNPPWQVLRACGLSAALLLPVVACGNYHDATLADSEGVSGALRYAPVLGIGVNFAENTTFGNCITMTDTVTPSGGFERRPYTETRVTSRQQLNEQLGVDASVSAKGIWGSGGASGSYFKNLEMSDESFFWLVNARYELATESIDMRPSAGFGLTQQAKEILTTEGVEGFYQTCGTHFYMSRKLGAQVAMLYEFQSHSNKVVENLKAKADYSGFGWEVSASFQKFMESARRDEMVKVHSLIVGGDKTIEEYPDDPSKLKEMLRGLRAQLEDTKKGAVLEWGVQSYDIFPEVRAAKTKANLRTLNDDFRNDSLAYYYGLYISNIARIATLNGLIAQADGEEPLIGFSDASMATLRDRINTLQQQNDELRTRAKSCLDGTSNCATAALSNLAAVPPKPDRDFRGLGSWIVRTEPREGSRLFMDLTGKPSRGRVRRFYARDKLMETSAGALTRVTGHSANAGEELVAIGNFHQVIDPTTGRWRVNLCVGDFAKTCNLRVVESPSVKLEDGCPVAKLQLTVFDPMGFIRDRFDFLMAD